jgi:hypothetical protein
VRLTKVLVVVAAFLLDPPTTGTAVIGGVVGATTGAADRLSNRTTAMELVDRLDRAARTTALRHVVSLDAEPDGVPGGATAAGSRG